MPAPPQALVEALRKGTVHRHVFFELTHTQGTLRVWDGVRDFKLGADTYIGVGGGHEIEGLSDSGDIQNHTISCKITRVPLQALFGLDTNIRGESATIRAAWFYESGEMILGATRIIARAKGSHLISEIDAKNSTVTAVLRGPLSEWLVAPKATYTPNDQTRRGFTGDTGFNFVKELENASIAGWSKDEEASGGVPIFNVGTNLYDSVTLEVIGAATNGPNAWAFTGSKITGPTSSHVPYQEQGTGAQLSFSTSGAPVTVGGNACYVDIAGDVRTAGGALITPSGEGASTNKLRKQGAIAGDGSATATTVSWALVYMFKTGGTDPYPTATPFPTSGNYSDVIYASRSGIRIRGLSGIVQDEVSGVQFVEDVTGTGAVISGGLVKVGGTNCVVSTTGVILTSGGRRVIRPGNADDYLRVWT